MNKPYDRLWINATLVCCEHGYDVIENAAIAVSKGKIAWLGRMDEMTASPEALSDTIDDVDRRCMTPGLIDCHTHLVYAGNRSTEFEQRINGVSYETIAKNGGGIHSTVNATRMATEAELFELSLNRAKVMLANGTTTIEIKSGYGLNWDTESKMLRVAKQLEAELPLTVKRTFLGAHVVPKEYHGNRGQYVDLLCEEMIPRIAHEKLADAIDVFCETIAFTKDETEMFFQTATQYGLRVKCHAGQLSNQEVVSVALKYNALSVDHLEHLSSQAIRDLSQSSTVAVVLPGAYYYLRETQTPPIDAIRNAKIPIAIATDCNPGTSPILSLPTAMNMASVLYRLTPEEALMGVTRHAAKALGIADHVGSLKMGYDADFAIWDIHHPSELSYYLGHSRLLHATVKNGVTVNHVMK